MTSQSGLRLMGQETWRTTLCQRPNHSLPIQPCGRHLRVRVPTILQKSKSTSQNPGGASLLWLPLGTFYSYSNFFHGAPLFQSGSNKGSFGTHRFHHMKCKHQPSYCYILARHGLRAFEPAVPIGGPHHCPRHQTIRGPRYFEGDLYSQLCVSAWNGNIQGTGGGPNCRTWSILRWFPKPGFPKPVRGRREPDCWGFSVLETSEAQDTDKDSLLLLRQLLLSHISNMRYKGPGLPWCFLEHPEDPKLCSMSPSADRCSTIWQTQAVQAWIMAMGLTLIHFDECELGQSAVKSTVLELGKKIPQLATNVVDKVIESIHRQDKHHPFPPDLLEQVRSLVPGSRTLPLTDNHSSWTTFGQWQRWLVIQTSNTLLQQRSIRTISERRNGIWIWSLAPLLLRRRHPSVDVTYQNYAQVLWPLLMKETRSAPSTMAPGEVPMHTFRPIQKNAPQPLQSWTASTAFAGCRRHKKNRDTRSSPMHIGIGPNRMTSGCS